MIMMMMMMMMMMMIMMMMIKSRISERVIIYGDDSLSRYLTTSQVQVCKIRCTMHAYLMTGQCVNSKILEFNM